MLDISPLSASSDTARVSSLVETIAFIVSGACMLDQQGQDQGIGGCRGMGHQVPYNIQ